MEGKVELSKLMKKGKGTLIAGIVVLLMALSSLGIGYFTLNQESEPDLFSTITKADQYGKIDVEGVTLPFAESDDEKVYFVWDEDRMYLANISEEAFKSLRDIYDYTYNEDMDFPGTVTIKGSSVSIPSDLKKLAIEYYNKWFAEDGKKLTTANFNTVFGSFYLDTHTSPAKDNFTITLMVAVVLGFCGICLIITYLNNRRSSKKSLAVFEGNMERLEKELNDSQTSSYKKYKLFLTENYIVTYAGGLKVVSYQDIVWLYPKEVTYRGVTTRTIYVVTNDSKMHTVLTMSLNKKTREETDEIYQAVLIKLPKDALAGYTNENRLKVKELYTKKEK